ncbi:MAG TPA: tripartite tricarboxylate transporter substrate-binding protein [Xanthobacteraceae bacterium]|nr:tripartite tricarboxylate transporter substrate-binding protein [Xanthobacteraceae bacterium]
MTTRLRRRAVLRLTAGAAGLPFLGARARAAPYPTRAITIVIGYSVGGATDTTTRILADRLQQLLAQPVVVENVTGANGSIAVGRVVRAAPDGYTLSIGDLGTHVVNQATYALPYDVQNDLTPIALLRSSAFLVVAKPSMPGGTLQELITWLRANPEKATAGTGGVGGAEHLAGLTFENVTGIRVRFVSYRGGLQALQDTLTGQIDMGFANPLISIPHIRAATLKAYAVMDRRRLAQLPDVPTVDEAGAPGAYYTSWTSLWAPKGTPQEIIARLNAAVIEASTDPRLRARYRALAVDVPDADQQTPAALRALQQAEIAKWWPIVKAAKLRFD